MTLKYCWIIYQTDKSLKARGWVEKFTPRTRKFQTGDDGDEPIDIIDDPDWMNNFDFIIPWKLYEIIFRAYWTGRLFFSLAWLAFWCNNATDTSGSWEIAESLQYVYRNISSKSKSSRRVKAFAFLNPSLRQCSEYEINEVDKNVMQCSLNTSRSSENHD